MRNFLLALVMIFWTITAVGQSWINLEYPMSGILGRPVDNVTYNRSKQASNINWKNGIKYDATPETDTYQSAESIIEYQDKFRNFITKYFNTDKHSVRSVQAHNVKVRSLSQASIDKLQEGNKYIYEGVAADSATIWISVKKNLNIDITKAINDAANIAFNGAQSTELIKKILPVLDSLSYKSNDSVYYKSVIKNPNVYSKVKIIKLNKVDTHDWESICLYFFDQTSEGYPKVATLSYDPTGVDSRTKEYYPEGWKKSKKDVLYSLGVKKIEGKLQLWLYESNSDVNNSMKPIKEIPFVDEDGKRYWRMDRALVYQYTINKIIKKVLIQVAARQLDNNTIEIINWRGDSSICRNAVTYMRYPEFNAVYIDK